MASFDLALALILDNEKGYNNDSDDPGGETFAGVARHFHPDWAGWTIIDSLKASLGITKTFKDALRANSPLQDAVKSFYLNEFWKFSAISSQDVANKLMDLAVNLNPATAVRCLQASLKYVLNKPELVVDGLIGPQTIALANAADPTKLLLELRAQQVLHYCEHSKQKFMLGLMRRGVK